MQLSGSFSPTAGCQTTQVDGIMIETHNDPSMALCDGAQSLDLGQFSNLMADIKRRIAFEGKSESKNANPIC
ncbi:MAG TPA: hypothetical protein DDW83_06025 [Peptococcaceae bacterium]|nr:hypothetical protein [Peptococcaceae bacterium]